MRKLLAVVIAVLLSILLSTIVGGNSNVNRNRIFYIIPTNSSHSCCPSKHSCVTLDDFAKNQLPDLEGANITINLLLLSGHDIHTLTVPMNFVGMSQVNVSGKNCKDSNDQIKVLMKTQNIRVSNVQELDIRNLVIDGGGQQSLIVQNDALGCKLFLNNVTMLSTALQVPSEVASNSLQFVITSCLFKASKIEVVLWYQLEPSIISNSMFLSEEQQYTVAICNPTDHHLTKQYKKSLSLSPQLLLHNVIFADLDLQGNLTRPTMLSHTLCDLNRHGPTDIYIAARYFMLNITNSSFRRSYGSALQALNCSWSQFTISNTTFQNYMQGALLFTGDLKGATITLDNVSMTHNSINTVGSIVAAAALTVYPIDNFNVSTQVWIQSCLFSENSDNVGNQQIIMIRALYLVNISNSSFKQNNGTVIGAYESELTFIGNNLFDGNLARQGGAIVLKASLINIATYTNITFSNNYVFEFGGALLTDNHLFYLQNDYSTRLVCFYQPLIQDFAGIRLNFMNNLAINGGDHIYGTGIRNYCKVSKFQLAQEEIDAWHNIFTMTKRTGSYSPISSSPMRVCLCGPQSSPTPQCEHIKQIFSKINHGIYPGEVFNISVATVGAEFGATVGPVYAKLLRDESIYRDKIPPSFGNEHQDIQYVRRSYPCATLSYSVWSTNPYEIMYLASTNITLTMKHYGDTQEEIENAIDDFKNSSVIPASLLMTPIFINLTLHRCPKGFMMTGQCYCDCYSELKEYNVTCSFKDGRGYISREGNIWIGMDDKSELDPESSNTSFTFNSHCPYDRCKKQPILIDLEIQNSPDHQCAFNHSGVLCGGCKTNYSVAIGSSHCLYCSSNNYLLLLLFFIAAGPLLYMFIAILNLTITKGAINGLLFYANIVWIYQNILFPSSGYLNDRPSRVMLHILRGFVAWLNLDFGIEACFINGLDAFWKSILQYAFPLYIWIIAGIIITLYRYSNMNEFQKRHRCIANLTGNPVDVLVTFVLLSYTKLVRTIKDAFGFAILTSYPEKDTKVVWALDGGVDFLKGKHVASFVIAALVLIATLLYTVYILIMGLKPYLCECNATMQEQEDLEVENRQQIIRKCKFCRISRILNFVDMPLPLSNAHFASLEDGHRYWLGLTLLLRDILLLIFTALFEIAPSLNLPILFTVTTLLLFHMAWNRTHKDKSVQLLESLSLSNLIFLSGGVQYADLRNSYTWKYVIITISLGMAVIQFVGVISHCFYLRCIKKKCLTTNTMQTYHTESVEVRQDDYDDEHATLRSTEEDTRRNSDINLRDSIINETEHDDEYQPIIADTNTNKHAFNCLCCCK